jgi:signal peptidase II
VSLSPSRSKCLALLIGIFVLWADFISKYFTQKFLSLMSSEWPLYPYGGIGLFKNFLGIEASISYATNKGAAWGLFAHYQDWLILLRVGLVIALSVYFFLNRQRAWNIPLALILAGALGNILDYFLYGHVIDMFHFVLWGYDFPVFNIADSSIFIGICWLILLSIWNPTTLQSKS